MLGLIPALAAASSSSGSGLTTLVLFGLMGGFFYLFLIRPQRQRSRAQRQLLESVEVGDEVMTVGGMFGTVRAVEDDRVTLEVAPNVEITFAKSAIGRKLVFDDEEYEEYEGDEEEQEEEEADEPS